MGACSKDKQEDLNLGKKSLILNGTTDPANSLGAEGDYYLNLHSKTLFGPKLGNDWGLGISLPQTAKVTGAFLNGRVAPAASLGEIGDFYIDLAEKLLYGAKTEQGWGVPMHLSASAGLRMIRKDNLQIEDLDQIYNASGTLAIEGFYKIKVGDIKAHIDQQLLKIKVRVNHDFWSTDYIITYFHIEDITYRFSLEVDEYSYDEVSQEISLPFIWHAMGASINEEGENKFKEFIAAQNIQIQVELFPLTTVEYLSQKFPALKIDQDFISKYYSLTN